MLVSIYEKQRYFENKYLKDGFEGPSDGINIRNLIQKGYFVYLPDISLGYRGTGEAALACIHNSLDAIQYIDEINFQKVGKNDFDIVNIGFSASKNIKVFSAHIPLSFTTMWNPSNKYARIQFATTLF